MVDAKIFFHHKPNKYACQWNQYDFAFQLKSQPITDIMNERCYRNPMDQREIYATINIPAGQTIPERVKERETEKKSETTVCGRNNWATNLTLPDHLNGVQALEANIRLPFQIFSFAMKIGNNRRMIDVYDAWKQDDRVSALECIGNRMNYRMESNWYDVFSIGKDWWWYGAVIAALFNFWCQVFSYQLRWILCRMSSLTSRLPFN